MKVNVCHVHIKSFCWMENVWMNVQLDIFQIPFQIHAKVSFFLFWYFSFFFFWKSLKIIITKACSSGCSECFGINSNECLNCTSPLLLNSTSCISSLECSNFGYTDHNHCLGRIFFFLSTNTNKKEKTWISLWFNMFKM